MVPCDLLRGLLFMHTSRWQGKLGGEATHPAFFVSPCHQGQYDMTRQADHSGGDREAGVCVCVWGNMKTWGAQGSGVEYSRGWG